MKINLLHGAGQKMSGFSNVSSLAIDDDEVIWCDVRNLDVVVDDGEAAIIIARDVINYMPKEQILPILSHWVSKLRHGGRIVVGAMDLHEVVRQIYIQDLDMEGANRVLYGEGELKLKRNIFPISSILDFFQDNNMTIIKAKMDIYNMTVEAERP